ncbi:MAG: Na+/H+ antiporter subunit E [Bacteroidales bacterium]|nr:Na+/H+ antiporter subunit E [Bacteroidales bacterium]
MENVSNISKLFYTWIILFIVWLAFTSTLAIEEVVTGLLVSLIVALLSFRFFTGTGLGIFAPKKIFYLIQYFFVFIGALIKANFHVAKIVLSPKLPINPGIVEFETKLKSDFAKMVLANSITLTPGTFTVDIVENRFYIHWLEVSVTDEESVYKEIAEGFEKILLKIYE